MSVPYSHVSSLPMSSSWEPNQQKQTLRNSTVLVRAARQQDLSSLADLLARSFHAQNGSNAWLYPVIRMGIYEDLRSRLRFNNTQYVCLVAVKVNDHSKNDDSKPSSDLTAAPKSASETIVGTVEIGPRSTPIWLPQYRQSMYLSNLAVKPEARRQGVALQLLRNAEQIALNWGHKEIYLHVLENNHGARRLYWKAGFRLKQIEFGITNWLLGQPRQLYLHKHIS